MSQRVEASLSSTTWGAQLKDCLIAVKDCVIEVKDCLIVVKDCLIEVKHCLVEVKDCLKSRKSKLANDDEGEEWGRKLTECRHNLEDEEKIHSLLSHVVNESVQPIVRSSSESDHQVSSVDGQMTASTSEKEQSGEGLRAGSKRNYSGVVNSEMNFQQEVTTRKFDAQCPFENYAAKERTAEDGQHLGGETKGTEKGSLEDLLPVLVKTLLEQKVTIANHDSYLANQNAQMNEILAILQTLAATSANQNASTNNMVAATSTAYDLLKLSIQLRFDEHKNTQKLWYDDRNNERERMWDDRQNEREHALSIKKIEYERIDTFCEMVLAKLRERSTLPAATAASATAEDAPN